MLLLNKDWEWLKLRLSSERLKDICEIAQRLQMRLNIMENICKRNTYPPTSMLTDIDNLAETLVREFTDMTFTLDTTRQEVVKKSIQNLRKGMEKDWEEIRSQKVTATKLPLYLKTYTNFLYNIVHPVLADIVRDHSNTEEKMLAEKFERREGIEFERTEEKKSLI